MSWGVAISGEYPKDWPEIADRVRAEADHRCVRCGHRFKTGEHGKGEWSPCDEKCRHRQPLGVLNPKSGEVKLAPGSGATAACMLANVRKGRIVVAQWRILTVHHLDGNKANCEWWNLLPLCQRCHLTIQARVDPQTPYFLEHSPWFRPYVAGFYAARYLGLQLTREEATLDLEWLSSIEINLFQNGATPTILRERYSSRIRDRKSGTLVEDGGGIDRDNPRGPS